MTCNFLQALDGWLDGESEAGAIERRLCELSDKNAKGKSNGDRLWSSLVECGRHGARTEEAAGEGV